MEEQLTKKNCTTGEYSNIYPVTTLSAVKDLDTGETLDNIVSNINHIYLPFKENSKMLTRQQVPMKYRKQGLWITYISCQGNTVTEWYNSTDFSDKAWGDCDNWTQYLDHELITNLIRKILSWYKA